MNAADVISAVSSAQTGCITVLVELLIDRGLLNPDDVITRYRQLLVETEKTDAGAAGKIVVETLLHFVETKYAAQGSGGGSTTPH